MAVEKIDKDLEKVDALIKEGMPVTEALNKVGLTRSVYYYRKAKLKAKAPVKKAVKRKAVKHILELPLEDMPTAKAKVALLICEVSELKKVIGELWQ